ncbi:MAG: HD domain-containing protein, partial [Dehalococcoidia bacterium]
MDRESTIKFLQKHVKTDVLMRHLLGVEAAMQSYARKFGEDEEEWGIAGLVHDFDWEIAPSPEEHPMYGANLLREEGF